MSKKDKAREAARKAAREAAQKQAKRSKRGGSSTITPPEGISFFKPPEEDTITFDILGFKVGKNRALLSDVKPDSMYYKVSYKKHGSVGPEEKHIVCPSTYGNRCPMEEELQKQKKSGAEYDDFKALRPSDRDLFIIHHKGKLLLWDIPWWWFGKLLDIEIGEEEEKVFWFPEDNLSIRATFETDSFGTKATAVRFKKRKDDIDDEILEQAAEIDLAACVNEVTYEEVERLMHGVADDDEDGPDKDEPEDKGTDDAGDDDSDDDNDGDNDAGASADDNGDEGKKPDCFGKEFDTDDDDCEDCNDHRKACKKAMKKKEDKKDSGKGDKKSDKKSDKKDKDKGSDGECPHKHKFGKDFDEFDECDDCDSTKACEKASKG